MLIYHIINVTSFYFAYIKHLDYVYDTTKFVFILCSVVEIIAVIREFMQCMTVYDRFSKIVDLYKRVFIEIFNFTQMFVIYIVFFALLNYVTRAEVKNDEDYSHLSYWP